MNLFTEYDNVRTLYVIGNGFDLHHGMKTSYADFRYYLIHHGHYNLVHQMEQYFTRLVNNKDNFPWNDIENALGEPDIQHIYDDSNEGESIDYDHMMRSTSQLEDRPPMFFGQALSELYGCFEEWVNSIEISDESEEDLNNLDAKGIFLSFNYTETLEKLYGIPRNSITYIHGRRGTKDKLIFGHNNIISWKEDEDGKKPFYELDSLRSLTELANQERKDTGNIIASNARFWSSIEDVDKVIVYGHSLNEIDRPYFEKIRQSIQPNAEWFFGCYNEKDKEHAHILSNVLKIHFSSQSCFDF